MRSTEFSQWGYKIQNLGETQFWMIFIGAIIVAGVAFYYTFLYFKRARIIEDTPTSRIRSAAQGYVELKGVGALMDGPEIIAPYSKQVCTWYRFRAEKLGEDNSRVIDKGCSDELFVLLGDTGRCVIDPDGAHVTPAVKDVWYSSEHPPRQLSRDGLFGNRLGARYRYTEERMHPGDPLYAIGWFASVGGQNEIFNTRDEVRQLIAKWKTNPSMMAKFDLNKDGKIDMQEWDTARKAAHQVVKKNQSKRSVEPPTHVMTKPAERDYPFLLSTLPQHQLTRHYRMYALGCFAGFLIAGAFAVWLFSARF